MRPALAQRTAPDPSSGAVSFHPVDPGTAPQLRERDFWRAVAVSVLATLKPWLR